MSPDRVAWPKVSVIIPARNEERHLEQALTSVLERARLCASRSDCRERSVNGPDGSHPRPGWDRQSCPQRSDDENSPPRWLGKNNALASGAAEASGEIVLYDADVVMDPSVLKRGVSLLYKGDLDHLAVVPKVTSSGFSHAGPDGLFHAEFFALRLAVKAQCKAECCMGIGALDLIHTRVYQAIGGHASAGDESDRRHDDR